jgi:hypothetical protein
LPITALLIVVATVANVGGTAAGSMPDAGSSGRGLVGSWRRAASMLLILDAMSERGLRSVTISELLRSG